MLFWFISFLPFLPVPTLGGIPLSFIRIGSAIIVLFWFTKAAFSRKIVLPFAPPAIFLFGFLVLNALSVLWAEAPQLSIRKMILWLSILPLTVVFFDLFNKKNGSKDKDVLIDRITLSGGILGLFAVLQFFSQFVFGYGAIQTLIAQKITPLFVGMPAAEVINQNSSWFVNIGGQTLMRAVAIFPEPHTLALFFGLILPFALRRVVHGDTNKKIWGFVLVTISFGLLLTFSRGAYIAMIVSIAPLVFIWRKEIINRRIWLSVAIGAIIFLTAGNSVLTRFISTFDLNEGSNSGRVTIWKNTIDTISANPVIGVGLGNFPNTQDVFAASRSPINAHNSYLEIASETGMIGLLLWAGLLFSAIWLSCKNIGSNSDYAPAVCSGLLFYSTHAFFETIIYSPPNLVLLSLLLALAMHKDTKTIKY